MFSDLQDPKTLSVTFVRSMKMNDDVLVAAISPDGKYLAAALLDSTVKVNFSLLNFYIFIIVVLWLWAHETFYYCVFVSASWVLLLIQLKFNLEEVTFTFLCFGLCSLFIYISQVIPCHVALLMTLYHLFWSNLDSPSKTVFGLSAWGSLVRLPKKHTVRRWVKYLTSQELC